MRSVLLRHLPQLEPALQDVKNPFAPWKRVPAAAVATTQNEPAVAARR
jgi:hypothetical protein